jgi:hypothetical protein
MDSKMFAKPPSNRCDFIGGSDARVIMGDGLFGGRTATVSAGGSPDRRYGCLQ